MHYLLSEDARRNPYPLYAEIRGRSPVLRDPESGLWMVFDYDGVKRLLSDHATFSSHYGPEWMIFMDPPRHTKLRSLVSQAFTPRSIVNLDPTIRQLSRELLEPLLPRGEMDMATDYAMQLPLAVIAGMLGIPRADRAKFFRWNHVMLAMSRTIGGTGEAAASASSDFVAANVEMAEYITALLEERRTSPRDDLLTRLGAAEVEGQRLTGEEILGFFQLLLLAGSETTTNLINIAVLCFIEHPDQLALLRRSPELLPGAIEEILRYRSPLQWMYRLARRDVEFGGATIPAGQMVLAMIGSANRDPRQFADPERFDITRDAQAHLAFGHGVHFCLGAPLARLEGRVAIGDLLAGMEHFELASDEPWQPRVGTHVHGPERLPIRFRCA